MGATIVFVFVMFLSIVSGLCLIPAIYLLLKKNAKKVHKFFCVFFFSLSVIFILPMVFVAVMVPVQMFISIVYNPIVQRQVDGELVTAIKKNNYERTKKLLAKGMPVNVLDKNGYSPLAVACEYADEKLVALLIESGADVNERLNESQTPLYIATVYEKPETVRLLIAKKADVNAYTSNNFTCLMDAAIRGDYDIADQLIKAGIDVNAHNSGRDNDEGSDDGATALMYAASADTDDALPLVELLLKSGADVNAVDTRGRTPLIWACTRFHIEIDPGIIRLLLDNRADAGIKDMNGTTAYEYILNKIETQKDLVKQYDNDYQRGLLRDYETIRDWLKK